MDDTLSTTPSDLDRLAVGRSLQIEDFSDMEKHQNRLDRIIEWAQMKGAKDTTGYLAELASLRNRIGNPSIYDLSAYLQVEMEDMQLKQQRKTLDEKEAKTQATLRKFEKRDDKGRFL